MGIRVEDVRGLGPVAVVLVVARFESVRHRRRHFVVAVAVVVAAVHWVRSVQLQERHHSHWH